MPVTTSPAAECYERVLLLMSMFEGVRAVGLIGSRATGRADPFSDVNLLVLTSKSLPSGETRLHEYRTLAGQLCTFDVDTGSTRHDAIMCDAVGIDIHWCSLPAMEQHLRDLSVVFSSDESLAASLAVLEAAYDPGDVLPKAKRLVPPYSEERAIHRVRRCLQAAQLDFNVTRRLEIAAIRGDVHDFAKTALDLTGRLVWGLFALNQQWHCEQKRLDESLASLQLMPPDLRQRIESVTLYREGNSDLAACHDAIHRLYEDTTTLARAKFGAAAMPVEWK